MDTRKSLEDEVLGWLDESGDVDQTRENVRSAILQAHVRRTTKQPWNFMLWHTPQTFNLVVGQRNYVLHSEYDRPFYFRNTNTGTNLKEKTFRHYDPSFAEEGAFILWGRSPVRAHSSAASKLSLVSSSAADAGSSGRGLYVRGETADGVVIETIVPNGLTPVESVGTFLPGGLLQVSKFGIWAGKAILTSNAGAVTNLVLLPDEVGRSYPVIRLLWEPTQTQELEYNFYRVPNPLPYDESIPDIPYPYSRVLVWDALLDMMAYDGQLDGTRKEKFGENQEELDSQLRMAYLEGQSVAAETRSVHYIDEDLE